jgi:N-acetylglutamate synthase-like GNAT family acetyltransferase
MHVREARKHEEVWLLDQLDEFGFTDPAFRSRDYTVAVDDESGEKVGFGRLRVHSDAEVCEVTNLGTLPDWRGSGVAAHVLESLVDTAEDLEFEVVYSMTDNASFLEQFGFERIDPDDLPPKLRERLAEIEDARGAATAMRVDVAEFGLPRRLHRRWEDDEDEIQETAEDFGIDPEKATYKYDTGRR